MESSGEINEVKKREGWREAWRLFGYLLPYKKYLAGALVALVGAAGLSLVFPWFIGGMIGGAFGARAGSGGAEPLFGGDISRIMQALLVVLACQAVCAFLRIFWTAKAGESALTDLRRDTYANVIRLPMAFFGESRVGELTSRISADISLIRDTLITTVPQFLRQMIVMTGGIVIIMITSLKLTLFMILCLPVIIVAAGLFGRGVRKLSARAQDRLAESSVVVEETLQGVFNVKAFGNESYETARYGEALRGHLRTSVRAGLYRALFISFIIFALFGVIVLVVWFGARMMRSGEIDLTDFTRFVLYTSFLGGALGSLAEVMSQFQQAVGATKRVRELLGEVPEALEEGGAGEGHLRGDLAVDGICFSYPTRREDPAIQGVSFKASRGEKVALVGQSGAGKSTLVALILRFYGLDSGTICLDGRNIADYPLAYLRSQIAVVPQEVLLFGGSVGENIAYGNPKAPPEAIEEAARKANAHDFIEALPDGYDTAVGERGLKLSGGQRQRIAIARAILADPALLILDEATSALDSESESLVHGALEKLMEGRTSLIIAHRLATVRGADRIVVLEHGRSVDPARTTS